MFTRRSVISGFACSLVAFPSQAATDAQKVFMIEAIKDIRKGAGLPIEEEALQKRPRHKIQPERWGGVCVPVAFADFDWYYTDGPMTWLPNPGQKLPKVEVPKGFCCDMTSIPQFFWSFGLPKTGRYAYAAIVHDYLYWEQKTTRDVADEILYTAMIDSEVGGITREAISIGVSKAPYFAQAAWDRNAKERKAGGKRLLKSYPPRDRIVAWTDWSKNRANFRD